MATREQLQAVHDAIRATNIPGDVAGISTRAMRENVDSFCAALQGYIDSLGQRKQTQEQPCSQFEEGSDEWRECMLQELGEYGVVPAANMQALTPEQLARLLSAVQTTGRSLAQWLEICAEGPQTDDSESTESAPNLTPQEVFQGVFGPVDFGFDPNASTAHAATLSDAQGNVISVSIVLAPSTFGNEFQAFADEVIEGIIIHELGHPFQNLLGVTTTESEERIFTIRPFGAQSDLEITVSAGTPRVLEGYLRATQQYWSGEIGFDPGTWLHPDTGFRIEDRDRFPMIEPLTSQIYDQLLRIEVQCPGDPRPEICNIDRRGQPLPPGAEPVYILRAGYFIVDSNSYSRQTDVPVLFYNENRRSPSPSPEEGFADTFSAMTRLGTSVSEEQLPGDEPRRVFFEENICGWLYQLLGLQSPNGGEG